jgi:hypothetical protein
MKSNEILLNKNLPKDKNFAFQCHICKSLILVSKLGRLLKQCELLFYAKTLSSPFNNFLYKLKVIKLLPNKYPKTKFLGK